MKDFLVYPKILGMFLSWYYKDAPMGIIGVWRNFILFIANYFSIFLLFKTLFSPWKRISESYGRGFDIGRFFSALFLNLLSRSIGFIIRITVITIGIVAEFIILAVGIASLALWFFLPIILIWAIIQGIMLL